MTLTIEPMEMTSVSGLQRLGFEGFRTVESLRDKGLDSIDAEPGVYLILRCSSVPPRFLAVGTGGHFKGKDPNVTLSRLGQEWVEGALVLYVGQAGSNSQGTLRRRIGDLIRFGSGAAVGHRGGRLVWQLRGSGDLVVCWQTVQHDDPRSVESELIRAFKSFHDGRRPFANLRD